MSAPNAAAPAAAPGPLTVPWSAPPPLSARAWAAIEREALRVNDRYLLEVIEGWAFCPFAKEGRKQGTTARHVHRAGAGDAAALLALFDEVAAKKQHAVTQVLFPLVEVDPESFSDFCYRLTALGNARLPAPALACAPLHPALPYSDANPFALVPLFRRAPDPTLQWVRLDGLEAIYQGRSSGTTCPGPEELERLLKEGPKPAPRLYDRVAETNAQMARRLGVERVAALLRALAEDGRRAYRRVVLEDAAHQHAEAAP